MEDKWTTVDQIREFNRFYTVLLGFLNRNYLNSGYSVTETRILFELKQRERMSANRLIDLLHLDKGYVSRLIRNFEQKGMVTRTPAPEDKRTLMIQLTSKGRTETEKLIDITNLEIYKLIGQLDPEACDDLCHSMKKVMDIFSGGGSPWEENSKNEA